MILPVELTFDVNLQLDSHRFHAKLEVPLLLSARAAEPLKIVIDIEPPSAKDVLIDLKAEGLRASMLSKVVGIEGELQRFVARYVGREVQKPSIAKVRIIDVVGAIDGAMKGWDCRATRPHRARWLRTSSTPSRTASGRTRKPCRRHRRVKGPELTEIPVPSKPRLPDTEFGRNFMRLVLHKDRVLQSINRVLGEDLFLGPIGAGPGRVFARITAKGTFGETYGEELDDPETVGYKVFLPVAVTFDLDLRVDSLSFDADVVLPLTLRMYVEEPLTIVWDIRPPAEDEVTITVKADKRRSAVLQKMAGIDAELRRFIIKFVARELDKPHVRKATRIDVISVINGAWDEIAAQFLPNGPEDRAAL